MVIIIIFNTFTYGITYTPLEDVRICYVKCTYIEIEKISLFNSF